MARAGRSPLEQSWAYGEAVARGRGWSTRRFLARDDQGERALLQVSLRKILGAATLVRLVRGPLWLGPAPSPDDLAPLYTAIRARYRPRHLSPLLWTPELPEAPASDALFRRLGLRPMVTGYSTAWLDLRRSETALRAGLHGKWRNSLKAAESAGLEVTLGEPAALDWLLERHERQRRRRRLVARDGAFVRAMASAEGGGAARALSSHQDQSSTAWCSPSRFRSVCPVRSVGPAMGGLRSR